MVHIVQKKEICRCVNCGNEAEMVFTCSLPDAEDPPAAASESRKQTAAGTTRHMKATGTCSHCGNEADMWIDV